jgi:hypothetical protein
VVQRYLGFWDCNPATLIPLSPGDSAPLYVEMMGGAERIIARGRELHDAGEYLLAVEIVNKLVQAEPQNVEGKALLADSFEQIGYQQENPGHRNSFLNGAYELRTGISQGEAASSSSPDVIRAMSTELFLNFLGIRMDSRKAEGLRFTMNLVTPDNGEEFIVEMENATLTNIKGFQAAAADLTLTIDRAGPRADDDGRADAGGADRRRHGADRGGCRHPGAARRHHGRLRPAVRDHARDRGAGRGGRQRRSLRGRPRTDHRGVEGPGLEVEKVVPQVGDHTIRC